MLETYIATVATLKAVEMKRAFTIEREKKNTGKNRCWAKISRLLFLPL